MPFTLKCRHWWIKSCKAQPKTPFEVRRTEAFREHLLVQNTIKVHWMGQDRVFFMFLFQTLLSTMCFRMRHCFCTRPFLGIIFQISLQQENTALPSFRKPLLYSAYGEGWALYTGSLGKELGLYEDPYQYFGMLGMEMHRAIRLLVDTGMHAKGWRREQAIQFSLDNEAESEASITSEIERYMANPGQALSYKIGQIKIRELRAKAEEKLGKKFDLADFHAQVLQTGCVPLAILEDEIGIWMEKQ